METSNKRPYIIAGVAALIIVVAGGLLYVLFSKPKDLEPTEGIKTNVGTAVATGTSAINKEGLVVNQDGAAAKNDVTPGSPAAPQQSDPLAKDSIPSAAIKLAVSASGFSPAQFDAKEGQAVTVSLSSSDDQTHVFAFRDPSLSAVAIGVGPKETRAISFNAPAKPGEYEFYCNVPGHAARAEVGKMVVK